MGSVFDVDHLIVLTGERESISTWERLEPAPLLIAALCTKGSVVVEYGAMDGMLSVLAAALGAEVSVVTEVDDVTVNARVNAVTLNVSRDFVMDRKVLDLAIVHDPRAWQSFPSRMVLATCRFSLPDYIRVDLVEGRVLIDAADDDRPHLLVTSDVLDDVVASLEEAVAAFSAREPNPWAQVGFLSAQRWARTCVELKDEQVTSAQSDVDRAHSQMRAALDELRSIRASRTWKYRGIVRGWLRR